MQEGGLVTLYQHLYYIGTSFPPGCENIESGSSLLKGDPTSCNPVAGALLWSTKFGVSDATRAVDTVLV